MNPLEATYLFEDRICRAYLIGRRTGKGFEADAIDPVSGSVLEGWNAPTAKSIADQAAAAGLIFEREALLRALRRAKGGDRA